MSRSFKHVPIIKYDEYGVRGKRWANKRVRHFDVGNFGNYKKLYDRYDIYDQICNLYNEYKKIDGIPFYIHGPEHGSRLTYNEIMDYWRK
jgi:hypothetical protein